MVSKTSFMRMPYGVVVVIFFKWNVLFTFRCILRKRIDSIVLKENRSYLHTHTPKSVLELFSLSLWIQTYFLTKANLRDLSSKEFVLKSPKLMCTGKVKWWMYSYIIWNLNLE